MKCSKCGEEMHEVDDIMMCGSRFCTNYTIIKQDAPSDQIVYHREVMLRMKKTSGRILYLLETKPKCRNYDDWDFLNFYWEYLLGLTSGMEWTDFWKIQIKKFALPETVRRSHQMVCEPELKVVKALLQELHERKVAKGSPEFFRYRYNIDKYLKGTTYLPTDYELLKAKLEKQAAIFETVIMEKIEA